MDALKGLLSPEVLASILVVGSMILAIRSILFFTRTAGELRPKLEALERQVKHLKGGMSEKRKRIEELEPIVAPLKAATDKLTTYYEQLTDMRLDEDKRVHAAEEEEESKRKKRVQRTKMGGGGN
jgi:peptidoglycan hydrolase CwlO-like protein